MHKYTQFLTKLYNTVQPNLRYIKPIRIIQQPMVYKIQWQTCCTDSMLYLVSSVLRFCTAHYLSLSPSKDNTLRLQDGCHLTLLHVTSVACTWADPIYSLGRPISELQITRLEIFTQPSALLRHFKISCLGLLWAINMLSSIGPMIPNNSL